MKKEIIIKIPPIEKIPFIKAYHKKRVKAGRKYKSFSTKFINDKIPKKPGVYFLYDENKFLLYIGESINLSTRISNHRLTNQPEYIKFILCKKGRMYRKGLENMLIHYYKPFFQLFQLNDE